MSDELAKRRLVTVICNERSGGGRAGRMLPKVVRRLQEGLADAELHVVISTSYEQARDLTRAAALAAQSKDVVAVMGGDGMAHLGLNACAGTEATLAVLPAGTGNDFCRGVGLPTKVGPAVEAIGSRLRPSPAVRAWRAGLSSCTINTAKLPQSTKLQCDSRPMVMPARLSSRPKIGMITKAAITAANRAGIRLC